MKNSNDTQISLTDKDSRALMLTNNVSGVGYAVQAASDSKYKLLVHSHIGASTDKRELSTAALSVQELLQLDSFNTLSDTSYTTGDQLQACKCSGICTYLYCCPIKHFCDNKIRADSIFRSQPFVVISLLQYKIK